MELVDRIKVIMKVNQLTAAQMAEEIGVQRSNVSHVLSGRNKPSFEFLSKLLLRYPKVNAQWLITGKSQKSEPTQGHVTKNAPGENVQRPEHSSHQSSTEDSGIERIVIFYRNGAFKTYTASDGDD